MTIMGDPARKSWYVRLVWAWREWRAAHPTTRSLRRRLLMMQIQETQMRTNALIEAENTRWGGPAREMGTGSLDPVVQREEDDAILIACERALAEADPVHLDGAVMQRRMVPSVAQEPAQIPYTGEAEDRGEYVVLAPPKPLQMVSTRK